MSKHTLTIELAKPLEWVRVENDADIKNLIDMRVYAIRKDGREWFAYLDRWNSPGLMGFWSLEKIKKNGPSGHFPFEVALVETPPWPLIHKDEDGWIDLEKTPVELLDRSRHYELRGNWEGSAWGTLDREVRWKRLCTGAAIPPPYHKPTHARYVINWPSEWIAGPPEPETVEQRLARLEAQMEEVSKAAGKGGAE